MSTLAWQSLFVGKIFLFMIIVFKNSTIINVNRVFTININRVPSFVVSDKTPKCKVIVLVKKNKTD